MRSNSARSADTSASPDARRIIRCASRSRTKAWGFLRKSSGISSNASTTRARRGSRAGRARGSAFPSPSRSSRLTEEGFGPKAAKVEEQRSFLPCRGRTRYHEGERMPIEIGAPPYSRFRIGFDDRDRGKVFDYWEE